jgi:hypothetical protein
LYAATSWRRSTAMVILDGKSKAPGQHTLKPQIQNVRDERSRMKSEEG